MCRKNKILGSILILLGALTVLVSWDPTFFFFTLVIGIGLILARKNWVN